MTRFWLAAFAVFFWVGYSQAQTSTTLDLFKPTQGCYSVHQVDEQLRTLDVSLTQLTPEQVQPVIDKVYGMTKAAILVEELWYAMKPRQTHLYGFIDGCYVGRGSLPTPIFQAVLGLDS